MNLYKLLLILYLFVWQSTLTAQKISFKITLWGDSIGRMDVMHYRNADSTDVYTIESKSKAKFLWIVRNGYSKFEAVYKNGKLISSSHVEVENKKTKRSTKVHYDGKQYLVNSLEQGNSSFSETPHCSDASIYFCNYKNTHRIFYLPDAGFYELKHLTANSLEFKSADGHRNVYLFENGNIKGMEFHLPLAAVYMCKID